MYNDYQSKICDPDFLLKNTTGKNLYQAVKFMPVIDYHCHLSPKEIYEDKPFDNIGQIWLAGDHYKWRIMRQAGVEECYVTGNASWHDKFVKYAEAIEMAAGNPLYHWTHMELSMYFNITKTLCKETAEEIWLEANKYIAQTQMSPRKLMAKAGVEYVATTDDISDSLEYHKLIAQDQNFKITVTPSFRTDKVLEIYKRDYPDYIKKLSAVSGITVKDMYSLENALKKRLDEFCRQGCRFTDVGIQNFPDRIANFEQAERIFEKAITGHQVTLDEYNSFLGYMFVFLGNEYRKRELVMQLHVAVMRNINSELFANCGPDSGGDCIGDLIPGNHIAKILDKIECAGGLPETILYCLNPSMAPQLSAIAGSFRQVKCGTAWWFCDTKRGIEEQFRVLAETSNIKSFPGMTTDSRSFLSYARHDYFRRIICNVIGEWVEDGEFAPEHALALAEAICYRNMKRSI